VDCSYPTYKKAFHFVDSARYYFAMFLTPYTHLEWAYQLHYHLCFRTHRRRVFGATDLLSDVLTRIYELHDYHGLEIKLRPTDVQLLLSLKPEHAISDVLKKIKGESSNFLCRQLEIAPPLWARGYLARTSGKVRLAAAQSYLDNQTSHHGYDSRPLSPVFRFQNPIPTQLSMAHAVFDLKYHLVLSTTFRECVFDSALGEALVNEWLKVAAMREFALDRASVLPDHTHLIVRATPKMSIAECTLLLMNNGQDFVGTHWPSRLIEAGINQLWQPSAYAGSCGDLPTALLKKFLS
jgi:putative transposase